MEALACQPSNQDWEAGAARLIGNRGIQRILLFFSNAQVVTRYLLAELVKFRSNIIRAEMFAVLAMAGLLAQKAGCPFE